MKRLVIASMMLMIAAVMQAQTTETWLTQQLEPTYHEPAASVEVLQLDNGLQVVFMPNPAQPMVGIYCQVKVGSAREDFATSGMTHMLEHLLFNGTEKYTQEELYAAADRAGAYNNAHTTDFYTDFMMVLPSGAIETGLDLQSQMLFHSLIPEEKFAKEQGIVLGELAQSRDRGDQFFDESLRHVLYRGTSLELPTLGTTATIAAMQRDEVHAFYKRWYVPNNMILLVAGGFERDRALELIEQYYGQVPPRSLGQEPLALLPPLERTISLVRRGGQSRQLALVFEAPDYDSTDYMPFLMATELMGAEGTGIVTRALNDLPGEERPDFSLWWQAAPGFGNVVLQFELPEGASPDPYYRMVQDAVTGTLEMGLQDDALTDIMAMIRTQTLKQREQLRMTGIYMAEQLVLGGPDFAVSYLDRLDGVTPDEVERVLRTWFVDRPVLALLAEPRQEAEGAEAAAPGELTIERSELPGGAVLVSQTSPASELMAIHLTVRGRAQLDERYGKPGALNLVHHLLETGISGCDEACLAARLRRLGALVKTVDDPRFPMDDYYTNGRFSFVRVECPAESAREVLDLLAEMAQFSTFTRDDLERERADQLELLRRRQDSAGEQARRLLARELYGDHPLAQPAEGTVESVQAVTYDELRSLYRRAFLPENLILSVVSPFSHEELKAMLPDLNGASGRPAEGMPPLPVTTTPRRVTEEVGSPMSSIRVGTVREIDPDDTAALELLVAILSDRMAMDLRETRGLSYRVGAAIDVHGSQAVFTAVLNPPTPRLEEGEAALAGFLRGFDAATITQEELDTIRAARQGRLLMRRLDSISRAYYLAMAELDGDVFSYRSTIAAYDDVTLDDLQRVAAFFSELPLVTAVVN
jgi:zinc protease